MLGGMVMSTWSASRLKLFVARLSEQSTLNDEERRAIAALPFQTVEYARRKDILAIDEPTTSAFLVVSGMVGRFAQRADGVRQFTSLYLPGDMIDLQAIVRAVRPGGLNVLCDTTVLRIPCADLRALAKGYPAIAEAFWRDCALEAAILQQWTVNVGRRNARTRLAHLLCELAIRVGEDRQVSLDYALPLTQEHFADATALTAVHVNRCLKALGGCVRVQAGHVHICDWKALVRVAGFDAGYLLAATPHSARETEIR